MLGNQFVKMNFFRAFWTVNFFELVKDGNPKKISAYLEGNVDLSIIQASVNRDGNMLSICDDQV